MILKNGFMLFWTETAAIRARLSSNLSSLSKQGPFAGSICKITILYRGESFNFNFHPKLFSLSNRYSLEKPLVLEVTTEVTTPSKSGAGKVVNHAE